ncbi:hypothetical protein EIP86_000021 [Pleurotus ostreatoroseus]|nr:hypothetical protein EIP86_000021 [Pleurotus ostreatoroseus]
MADNVVNAKISSAAARRAAALQALGEQDKQLADLLERYHLEASRIESTKRSLRIQYNDAAPISSLPPELLALIFGAFVDDYWVPDLENSSFFGGHRMYNHFMCGWLVILQVCHRWRSVALDTPRLWTRITVSPVSFIQFAIAHSGDLPLDAFAAQHLQREPSPGTLLQCLLPEFPRLRSALFRMTIPAALILETAHTAGMKLQAPALKALTLIIDTREFLTSIPLLSEMDLPRLASLTLDGASFKLLQSLARPTLTVVDISFSPRCKPSELIDLLGKLPLLQRLELVGFEEQNIQDQSQRTPPWCRTISLPHLKYLSMKSRLHALDVTHLLDCLDFPVDTNIIILMGAQLDYPYENVDEAYKVVLPRVMNKALVSSVTARGQATQAAIPRIMKIWSLDGPCRLFNVALWSSVPPCNAEKRFVPGVATPGARLRLTIATPRDELGMLRFFDLVDLSKVVKLCIAIPEFPVRVWIRAFRGRVLPELQDLVLNNYGTIRGVLAAISTPLPASFHGSSASPQEHMSDSARCCFFPTLKTLTLSDCLFRSDPRKLRPNDLIGSILEALQTRAEHGHKLDRLKIKTPINLTRAEDIAVLEDPRVAKSVEIESGSSRYSDEDTDGDEDEDEARRGRG